MAPTDLGDRVGGEAMLPLHYPRTLEFILGSCLFSQSPSVGSSYVGALILSSASLARCPSFQNRKCYVQFSFLP